LALEITVIIRKNITFLPQLLDKFQVLIEFGLQIPGFVFCDSVRYATCQRLLVASERPHLHRSSLSSS
jgi:hypothetical protein